MTLESPTGEDGSAARVPLRAFDKEIDSLDRAELLASIPLFQGMSADDLTALAHSMVERRYQAGQIIFHQGEIGSSMYVVAHGHVNIHLPGEASRRISLKDISRGEFFGELALFDRGPRSASALARIAEYSSLAPSSSATR